MTNLQIQKRNKKSQASISETMAYVKQKMYQPEDRIDAENDANARRGKKLLVDAVKSKPYLRPKKGMPKKYLRSRGDRLLKSSPEKRAKIDHSIFQSWRTGKPLKEVAMQCGVGCPTGRTCSACRRPYQKNHRAAKLAKRQVVSDQSVVGIDADDYTAADLDAAPYPTYRELYPRDHHYFTGCGGDDEESSDVGDDGAVDFDFDGQDSDDGFDDPEDSYGYSWSSSDEEDSWRDKNPNETPTQYLERLWWLTGINAIHRA